MPAVLEQQPFIVSCRSSAVAVRGIKNFKYVLLKRKVVVSNYKLDTADDCSMTIHSCHLMLRYCGLYDHLYSCPATPSIGKSDVPSALLHG
jgi:hypothetical protein